MRRKGSGRDLKKELYWREIFRQHRQSGLNIRAFCRKNGLAEPLFYAWRREVGRRGPVKSERIGNMQQTASAKSARHSLSEPIKRKTNAAMFVPIKLSGGVAMSPSCEAVECVLPGGVILRCPVNMEPAKIASLVHAWEQRRC